MAVAFYAQSDHDQACTNQNIHFSRASFVRTGTATATGIHVDSDMPTVSGLPASNGTYYAAGFQGMAVAPSGGVLYQYSQYSSTGNAFFLLSREDRGSGGAGGTGGGAGGAGGTGGGAGGTGGGGSGQPPGGVLHHGGGQTSGPGHIAFVARNLVPVRPLDPRNSSIGATCPAAVSGKCTIKIRLYAASGTIARRTKSKQALLLGSGTVVLRPGTHGRIRIRFTLAGKRALRAGRRLSVRVKVDVAVAGRKGSFTTVTSITARPRHRRSHARKH